MLMRLCQLKVITQSRKALFCLIAQFVLSPFPSELLLSDIVSIFSTDGSMCSRGERLGVRWRAQLALSASPLQVALRVLGSHVFL